MKSVIVFGVLLLFGMGCLGPVGPETGPAGQTLGDNLTGAATGNDSNHTIPITNPKAPPSPVKYSNASAIHFVNFTDPKEGAFSLEVPSDWAVTNGSGLIRPYIDAGIAFEARSAYGQGFFFQDPYGYIYATPNAVLEYAGFTEGSLYGTSGGITKPMMVRHYVPASEFASELLQASHLNASDVNLTDRQDLLPPSNPLISQQSAAELSFGYEYNGTKMKSVVLVRTSLLEMSGTGIWTVLVMEYYSPVMLMGKTELEVLDMQRSFKIDPAWAAREQAEIRKRAGIIAQGQSDVSDIISSTFEMRSTTMDKLSTEWDNNILGVEDLYNTDTGAHYIVDSGSKYYWIDERGNIYGTNTDASPLPDENLRLLQCPGCS